MDRAADALAVTLAAAEPIEPRPLGSLVERLAASGHLRAVRGPLPGPPVRRVA